MAITRLTDIITVFESKWTYGDTKFGYEGEVNQDHDTQYPLMLIQPPESIIPAIYNGREEYSFEINFYNLYSQAAQSVVTLQKRWDNLQDLSNEWLDLVLKNYQDVTVDAYLNDESIEIERLKDVANDKLVQIKLVFTMSAFTKCFRPVSKYPTDFSNLAIWLKSDSGVGFDIPTKKVSTWADQSGNNNNLSQTLVANKPLRYGYGGQDDKSYLSFNGTSSDMISDANSPIRADFTIFEVSNIKTNNSAVFSYSNGAGISICIKSCFDRHYYARVAQEIGIDIETQNTINILGKSHIGVLTKNQQRITLNYYDSTNSTTNADVNGAFDPSLLFNEDKFNIGTLDNAKHLDGDVQEVIVYDRVLSDSEIDSVKSYLNLKYKIY